MEQPSLEELIELSLEGNTARFCQLRKRLGDDEKLDELDLEPEQIAKLKRMIIHSTGDWPRQRVWASRG